MTEENEMPAPPPMPDEPMNNSFLEFKSGDHSCEPRWECLRASVGEIKAEFACSDEDAMIVAASVALSLVASMLEDGWGFVPPAVAPTGKIDIFAQTQPHGEPNGEVA